MNKQPAAALGDAITILSNNWEPNNSDTKGKQITSDRPVTDTTVNAPFALGPSAESEVDAGNGQLENVIRFLENWNGKTSTVMAPSLRCGTVSRPKGLGAAAETRGITTTGRPIGTGPMVPCLTPAFCPRRRSRC